ncbi:hypothetical protein CRG98_039482 [Punica granatum]|uniref:GAG-pre-integrase domain-containing protein n=1 Tax=Punica granatum TaxID=22663 RepID=A0A2I0I8W9_PUNGR|nr:hypothetical protein CRG98_039482 [Punica granatum]
MVGVGLIVIIAESRDTLEIHASNSMGGHLHRTISSRSSGPMAGTSDRMEAGIQPKSGYSDFMTEMMPINGSPVYIPNGRTRATHFGKDRTTRKMIGIDELCFGGVHHLKCVAPADFVYQATKLKSDDLWHRRLGHPSHQVPFRGLPGGLTNKHCEKCQADSFYFSSHFEESRVTVSIGAL